ncbi:lipase family protein [Gordonia malaquae]|uniref:lipase family protein n=1 Tax=Gordonia malaquae TaxID=410332 RepID=UPI0030FDF9FD
MNHTRSRFRGPVTAAVALCAAVTMLFAGHASAAPTQVPVKPALPFPVPPTLPEFDPFYKPPQKVVDSKKPGELIAARRVHLAYTAVLPINIDAWQVSFRSTDTKGRAIPSVATVMKPRGRAQRPRPLLSFQQAEDSLGQYCRPSYLMQLASLGPLAGSSETSSLMYVPIAAAELGWAVVIPDTQGPKQAFGAGPLEGMISLDAIRAAENFKPMGLNPNTKVGLAGYSGGALATGHAAELHGSYAPELNIVGVAEGGIPADVGAALKMSRGTLGGGIIPAGAIGAAREYPELAQLFRRYLKPEGRAFVAAKENLCQVPTAMVLPFANFEGMFMIPNALSDPRAVSVMNKIKMGKATPKAPMFMIQSTNDWLIPRPSVDKLVKTYCLDPSANVQYLRDHFSEHITLDVFYAPLMIKFLKDRFNGEPLNSGCHTKDAGTILAASELWSTLLPLVAPTILDLLGKPVGR